MKFFLRTALVLSVLCSSFAFADAQPGQNYLSVMGTLVDDDDDRGADDEFAGAQIGLGFVLNERWNLEAIVQHAELSGFLPQDQFGAGVDLQRVINREGRFSPYLFAGVGYFENDRDNLSAASGEMYSTGLGFLADIFGDSGVALKAEYRYRVDKALQNTAVDNLFSLGLQLPFGEKSPKYVDSDGDGVVDASDRCPATPLGAVVDATGCEVDADKDGVPDSRDQCPMTRAGATVDSNGCERDSDGDGVKDGLDLCPNTVSGATVNAQGCELDSDGDKVVDRLDKCPNTRAGAQVDVNGCEIKEEITLPGVNFESNSANLLPGAERVMNDAAETLRRNPSISVEVAGHTDSDGAADYNESLSERRARTVRDYLAARGVAMNRMTVRGYGEAEPIASNQNAQGKAMNRRVVLRITSR